MPSVPVNFPYKECVIISSLDASFLRVILLHLFYIILCVDPHFPNNHSEGKNSRSNITLTVTKLELCIKYPVKVPPATDHEAPEGE